MKKLFAITLLVISALCGVYAAIPKSAKQAEKLIGNFSQTEKARNLISEALNDTTYTPEAQTYFIAGRIERETYKHFYKLLSINQKDPSVDHVAMADALMGAYKYFTKCMSLDSTYDKKGRLKVKYSPDITQWISTSAPAIYNAGIAYMNKKLYYPKAHDAFITYANLPQLSYFSPETSITDSLRANAYFYGGVMAYNAKEFEAAIEAFVNARKYGYTKKEVFLNEISALTHLAKADTTKLKNLSKRITDVAGEGLTHHGVEKTPVFIQKYVAGKLMEGKPEFAMAAIDTSLIKHKEMVMLHTMKAGVYAVMGNNEAAVAEYKVAAENEKADAETLKSASKFIAQYGIDRLDEIKGRSREARAKINDIRNEYLKPALAYAQRAAALIPDDPEISNTIETVNYRLH